jgi:uncharacterized protein YhhL (DUF1145 family)
MMEGTKLRRADFITSIILILFGFWILFHAFQMPMRESYGGVKSVWYVSPALLPIFIGAAVVVLGIILMVHAIKTGGAARFLQSVKSATLEASDSTQRFSGVILAIVSFVYLYIPRVDFFLAIVLFLSYFIPAFFYDSMKALRRLSLLYLVISAVVLVVFVTPLATRLNGTFDFATDVLVLIAIVILNIAAALLAKEKPQNRKRFRVGLVVSIVTPLIVTPIFRFALLVPFPHEGGIVKLMQLIYYSIR